MRLLIVLIAGVTVGTAGETWVLPFTGEAFVVCTLVPCTPLTIEGDWPTVLETIGGVNEGFFVWLTREGVACEPAVAAAIVVD